MKNIPEKGKLTILAEDMLKTNRIPLLLIISLLLCSCGMAEKKSIETFQLLETSWDEMLYSEFQREAAFYNNYDFKFNIASTPEEEAAQVEEAIARGVDAVVINPFREKELLPVVEKAYDAGIEVILVGQKVRTYKYTAYVGLDNKELGRMAAEHVIELLPDGGNIIEITGWRDAPFYKDRQEAFRHKMDSFTGIHTIGTFDGAWSSRKAHNGMDSLKTLLGDTRVDLIFGYGDEMIRGASESMNYPDAIYMGTDGIPGPALQNILNGTLDATFATPTGGSMAISTAVAVLEGLNFMKDNILKPKYIDKSNVDIVLSDNNEILNNHNKIDFLNNTLEKSKKYIKDLHIATVVFCMLNLFLLAFLMRIQTVMKNNKEKAEEISREAAELQRQYHEILLQKEIAERSRWQLESEREALIEAAAAKAEPVQEDCINTTAFLNSFRKTIEEHLDNPELSVDDIAANMNMSRAQLFRRIKANTGSTPNELLQSMRLEKAEAMLHDTEMTISEIAYAVGFSSPSYFSKCYKDKYGTTPSDVQ